MGLLDYADAAREKLKGLLGGMPLVQMAQGKADMPTMSGLLASLKAMPVFSPDAGQSAYDAALNIGPMGLGKIVYHGSPHKFDKFDASKIGTGEGAQAYGHGVYLADAPDVAQSYKGLAGPALFDKGGKEIQLRNAVERKAFGYIDAQRGGADLTKKYQRAIANAEANGESEAAQLLKTWSASGADTGTGGSLYKADLPDEWIPKMLDWDKPIKDQAEVLSALQKSGYLDEARKAGGFYEGDIASGLMEGRHLLPAKPSAGGKDVAEKLRRAGIPGIRYLDGGSRGKGQGSYNYVVFPGLEDQVKILERNGVPLGLLGGN